MEPEEDAPITEELNRIYCEDDSHLDPVMQQLMLFSIPFESWEDFVDESLDLFNKSS